ncbi:hypothetical protein ACYUJ6_00160 [Clostridium sp. JNZ X4-2]
MTVLKNVVTTALTRVDKNGIMHYFHRSVVCAMVGSDPHTVLDQEMLEPKKDSLGKDERLHIVKDALGLFKCREADKNWIVKKSTNIYTKIKAWEDDNFEMSDKNIKVWKKFILEIK